MNTQKLISQACLAFNIRNVDGALSLVSESVSWPKASEGGRIVGKLAVREYRIRQWTIFDPSVEILQLIERDDGTVEVEVQQIVRNRASQAISDTKVWHIYTVEDGKIQSMTLSGSDKNNEGPSSAFSIQGH